MDPPAPLSLAELRSGLATFLADPYPTYREMRDQSPTQMEFGPGGIVPGLDEPLKAWVLMKHDDVYSALRDHNTFSSARNPLVEKGFFPQLVLIMDDPPRHTRFRCLVNKAFTLKRVEALEPWIKTIAKNAFLDRFPIIKHGNTPAVRQSQSPVVFGFERLPLILRPEGH